MKKILITNYMLEAFTGSELSAVDLAAEFQARGWEAALGSFSLAEPLKGYIESLGIRAVDLRLKGRTEFFDIIWAQHFEALDACLLDNSFSAGHIVFSCLSPYDLRETPPVYPGELALVLANSPETKAMLEGLGVEGGCIEVFPNPAPSGFFRCGPPGPGPAPRKIAVVSNHIPAELAAAGLLLKARGLGFDHFGSGGLSARITPELLSGYGLVITIGRTVQACLAMGLPVYCYDRFGGPGYINPGNLAEAARFNFSGRDSRTKKSAGAIAAELAAGYAAAAAAAPGLKVSALANYHLPSRVDSVLERLAAAGVARVACGPGFAAAALRRQREFLRLRDGKEIQLFCDLGGGFNEETSFKLAVDSEAEVQEFVFKLPGGAIREFRLDPLNDSAAVRLESVRLDGYKGPLRIKPGQGARLAGRDIYFDTPDPQLILSAPCGFGPGAPREMRVKIRYLLRGAAAREAYLRGKPEARPAEKCAAA